MHLDNKRMVRYNGNANANTCSALFDLLSFSCIVRNMSETTNAQQTTTPIFTFTKPQTPQTTPTQALQERLRGNTSRNAFGNARSLFVSPTSGGSSNVSGSSEKKYSFDGELKDDELMQALQPSFKSETPFHDMPPPSTMMTPLKPTSYTSDKSSTGSRKSKKRHHNSSSPDLTIDWDGLKASFTQQQAQLTMKVSFLLV
jgi:hypothetical protein